MSRQAAEKLIIKWVSELENGTENAARYKELFKGMSNSAFETLMISFRDKKAYVGMVVPNSGKIKLSAKRSQDVCAKLGVKLFQRIIYTDVSSGEKLLTPRKYMVYHLTQRRQNQHLVKKKSIPKSDTVIDNMTGQVTGGDKGSRMSMPETLVLSGKGIEHGLVEMLKVRGGDREASYAMKKSLRETGGFSLAPIVDAGTKPTSVKTLAALLKAMHLDNTLGK